MILFILAKDYFPQEKKEDGACMLRRTTFSDSSKLGWEVLMVAERRGRSFPSEIQGLKGWPRRWIHPANTYI